jgi:hypothetical protein
MSMGLAPAGVAADLERDVAKPDLPALRALRVLGRGMLADVERVKALAQTKSWSVLLLSE